MGSAPGLIDYSIMRQTYPNGAMSERCVSNDLPGGLARSGLPEIAGGRYPRV